MTLLDPAARSERERFEAWAAQFKYDLTRADPSYVNEPYVNDMTDWSWLAWQAAIPAARVEPIPGVASATDEIVRCAYAWYESSNKGHPGHDLAMAVLHHKTAVATTPGVEPIPGGVAEKPVGEFIAHYVDGKVIGTDVHWRREWMESRFPDGGRDGTERVLLYVSLPSSTPGLDPKGEA